MLNKPNDDDMPNELRADMAFELTILPEGD